MKPLVLVIVILLVLAALFFTGVGVGVFGKDGEVSADKPPSWLKEGLGGVLPGRRPLELEEVNASPSFKPGTGAVTLGAAPVILTIGPARSKLTKVRMAQIVATPPDGVVVTVKPNDKEGVFASINGKRVGAKPLRLSVPVDGATITITAARPGAAAVLQGVKP